MKFKPLRIPLLPAFLGTSLFVKVLQRFTLVLGLALVALGASAQEMQHVIVKTKGSREALKQTIQVMGGHVDIEYQNIPAVAATLPAKATLALRAVTDFKVIKDLQVRVPHPRNLRGPATVQVNASGTRVVDLTKAIGKTPQSPADFSFNNSIIRANVLQDAGDLGQGVIVATIDSGIANNPTIVPSLAGSVIGGETFVPNDTVQSATSTQNFPHGTWTASMIAGHAIFFFPNTDCAALSVQFNSPRSVIDGALFNLPGTLGIPMFGVAPAASLYAFKVFSSTGASTLFSIILGAMDRTLTIKKNFLAGMPSVPVSGSGTEDDPFVYNSLNIRVVSISLGGADIFAGRDGLDIFANQLIDAGIMVSISPGNGGPSGASTASPGNGLNALTMGATITPTHDRIAADYFACLANGTGAIGFGLLYHPTNFDQVVDFSSRGPSADGRAVIGAVTAGFANFVQGADGSLSLVSGTSFSAPTGAGAAALLAAADPTATAKEIRNALIRGANDDLLSEHSTPFDRGGGYLDLVRSLKRLEKDKEVDDFTFIPTFTPSVEENLENAGIRPMEIEAEAGETVSGSAKLRPGDRKEFFVRIPKDVGSVTFNLTEVTPHLPPNQQNQIFGDDLVLAIHEAKMTTETADEYAVPENFYSFPDTFDIQNPEPGFMRITLMGDWTNAGRVSAAFTMTATPKPKPNVIFKDVIADDQVLFIPFNVPANLSAATFELTWNHDWTHYPTNDLDLVLIDPNGNFDFDGATLNGRERAVVNHPTPGQWILTVVGFTVFGPAPQGDGSTPTPPGTDKFKVEIFLTP